MTIDTLTARLTVATSVGAADRSYLEGPESCAPCIGGRATPFTVGDRLTHLARRRIDLLPEGPTARERALEHLSVVLADRRYFSHPLINRRLETPSAYDFTACSAVAVAERMPWMRQRRLSIQSDLKGWCTPAEVLVEGEVPRSVHRPFVDAIPEPVSTKPRGWPTWQDRT